MRERVEYGEAGRQEFGQGAGRQPERWAGRWVRGWHGRRPASGPRPVRPAGVVVMVRPVEAPRPVRDVAVGSAAVGPSAIGSVRERVGAECAGAERVGGAWAGVRPPGPRLLVRGTAAPYGRSWATTPLRRVVAGLGLVAASAAVVVALGLLARVAEPAVAPAPAGPSTPAVAAAPVVVTAPDVVAAPVVVTAEPGETVWDVAARVAPGRPGAEVAAVAERIVADNALRSMRLEPGQVLRVAGG